FSRNSNFSPTSGLLHPEESISKELQQIVETVTHL
ncbi:hypothetical protein TYRP_022188, partial [Tyrophagus putrescentiae]